MSDTDFTLHITDDTDDPYFTGGGSSEDVPGVWDIAIDGHGYMLDTDHPAFGGQSAYLGRMGIETIPLIRTQADPSPEPGESTANPEDLWPRAQSSWHKGAGQEYLDAADSDRDRFHTSLHVDPWTRGQLKLLNATSQFHATTDTNLQLLRVGNYVYFSSGHDVYWTQDPYTSDTTAVINVAETAHNVGSIATDGYTVYAALGVGGIHKTTRGASVSSHYSDLQATLVAFVKGRLMAAEGPSIYNVTAGGADVPSNTPLFTHSATDFEWIGFANGLTCIYAAGFSGDKSVIYRTAIKADGTELDAPVQAGELPDGEIVTSIFGYLGFVLIGTTIGVRVASADATGNLTLGPLIRTDSPARCFEGQGQYVWFGWDDYDSGHTGLGRLDLTIVNDSGAPAYATDLTASAQGAVTSVITAPNGRRMYAVSGNGYWSESATTTLEAGVLTTGKLSFGIPEKKIALRMALKHKPLDTGASVGIAVIPDDGPLVTVATSDLVGSTATVDPMRIPEIAASMFDIQITLNGDVTLERYDFRAYPTSRRGRDVLVPILLHELVQDTNGAERPIDVFGEYQFLQSLVGIERLVSYQELGLAVSVFIEDVDFQRHHRTTTNQWWNGTLLAKLKILGD